MRERPGLLIIAATLLAGMALAQDKKAAPMNPLPDDIKKQVAATDYASVRTKPFPVAVQAWTYRKYTLFETIKKVQALGIANFQAFPGQPLDAGLPGAVFDPSLSEENRNLVRTKLQEAGLRLVAYGVCDIGTTEESMRKQFDFARKMGIPTVVCEPADDDFTLLEKLVKEYGIRIAIHNHPRPSKYASPATVLANVKGRDERIGASADTGHWMREGIKPVEALRFLKGRILDLHLKDRVAFGTGQNAVDVAWGSGLADVKTILAELTLQDFDGYLTMEYENEAEVMTPEAAIRKSVAFVKGATYYDGYEQILRRGWGGYEKHGWNHYGPGYFEIDPKTGVLKSQGGMGLLWYARRMYKDFVLELDFKCAQKNTNSGIFVRVPGVPSSDDYIYHSFEIQIADDGQGIHRTGAAYDAEAPTAAPSRPTGEWNHFKIEFRGSRLRVELNGTQVLDWTAEPRGKIRDFAAEGYLGLQNHDSLSPVYFRDIFVKELE